VAALLRLKPSIRPSADPAWRRKPALKVIDCVLSLNRPYDTFVVPRLKDFERERPHVESVADLNRRSSHSSLSAGSPPRPVPLCFARGSPAAYSAINCW
jgi:hypothetical protein